MYSVKPNDGPLTLYIYKLFNPNGHTVNFILGFSGRILDSDVVGLAYVHSMCDVRSSVAITLDRGSRTSTNSVAGTAAHELGHLLNMGHDTGIYYLNKHFNGVPHNWKLYYY